MDFHSDLLAGSEGVPATVMSFDPSFQKVLERARAREEIRRTTGVDAGFDLGDDAFMAMASLAMLAPGSAGSRALAARLAAKVAQCRLGGRYRCFTDVAEFAADTDCTAVAAGSLHEHGLRPQAALAISARELLKAVAPRGQSEVRPDVVMVYWDDRSASTMPRGLKHDAVACTNVLYTLELARPLLPPDPRVLWATSSYVFDHLVSGRYLDGTRYYPDPSAFLFALARLCARFPAYAARFAAPLRTALAGGPRTADHPCDALRLALTIIASDLAGALAGQGQRRAELAAIRQGDGCWQPGPYYRMGRFPVYFGSSQFTTLVARRALREPT